MAIRLMKLLVKQLAIQLSNQKTVAKLLVIANPLSHRKMVTEWLVISRKNTPASRWSSDNTN